MGSWSGRGDYHRTTQPILDKGYGDRLFSFVEFLAVCGRVFDVHIKKSGHTYELTTSGFIGRAERKWAFSSFVNDAQSSTQTPLRSHSEEGPPEHCIHVHTVNIRLYALRLYDTLSYNWESNYVQNRPFCHCGAGEKLFLVAARTFVAHLFLHGCACVGVIHKRILTVPVPSRDHGSHTVRGVGPEAADTNVSMKLRLRFPDRNGPDTCAVVATYCDN